MSSSRLKPRPNTKAPSIWPMSIVGFKLRIEQHKVKSGWQYPKHSNILVITKNGDRSNKQTITIIAHHCRCSKMFMSTCDVSWYVLSLLSNPTCSTWLLHIVFIATPHPHLSHPHHKTPFAWLTSPHSQTWCPRVWCHTLLSVRPILFLPQQRSRYGRHGAHQGLLPLKKACTSDTKIPS